MRFTAPPRLDLSLLSSALPEDYKASEVIPGEYLVEGPVEIVVDDGRSLVSDRAGVALCGCKRSRCYPFCDTSHRKRSRSSAQPVNVAEESR